MRMLHRRPAIARVALALLCVFPALAADPVDALARCRALTDDTARLACYDAAAATFTADEALAPEKPGAGTDPAPTDAQEPGPAGNEPGALPTRIVSIAERPRGERVFELEDGSRWTEQTRERTRFREGDRVTVQRTALGGSLLVREAGGATRVRRLD